MSNQKKGVDSLRRDFHRADAVQNTNNEPDVVEARGQPVCGEFLVEVDRLEI